MVEQEEIEPSEVKQEVQQDHRGQWRCLQWIIAYAFLICFVFFVFNARNDRSGGGWRSRAKGTLRSIGSSQMAYQKTNERRVYGSLDALKNELFIAEGYTLGNMIEDYSMTWEVSNISTVPSEDFPAGIISTFTVIAYPRTRHLQTFAVTDDQVVRVYNPPENEFESIYHWDPIL